MFTSNAEDADRLGGRLPLLAPADLDAEQRQVYDALTRAVIPESEEGGFTARLQDGRFIGPFNALLRVPRIAAGLGEWTGAIARSGMADDVRQVVILTVGAAWGAEYEIDAHVAAARALGIPDTAIEAIVRQQAPPHLGTQADVARRLTAALVVERAVPDGLYREAVGAFGEAGVIGILCLIGQYQTISSILVCFRVPAPARADVIPPDLRR
jgi:4-carboxymuconolactone decarboxylase